MSAEMILELLNEVEDRYIEDSSYEYVKKDNVNRRRSITVTWKRYVAAATIAMCFIGGSVTAYALVHFDWVSMFFDNSEEVPFFEQLAEEALIEPVTVKEDDYQITVLRNLYSEEQHMGLLLCAFSFSENTTDSLFINNPTQKMENESNMYLTADGTLSLDSGQDSSLLSFEINDEKGNAIGNATEINCTGEKQEDGSYLLGIRYDMEKVDYTIDNWTLVLRSEHGEAHPINKILQIQLPKTDEFETITLTSDNFPDSSVVVSPIGIHMYIKCEKNSAINEGFAQEGMILTDVNIICKDGEKNVSELSNGHRMIDVEEGDKTNTWYLNQGFSQLIDIHNIESIEIQEMKFTR